MVLFFKIDDWRSSMVDKNNYSTEVGGWENGEKEWEDTRNEINLTNINTNEHTEKRGQ